MAVENAASVTMHVLVSAGMGIDIGVTVGVRGTIKVGSNAGSCSALMISSFAIGVGPPLRRLSLLRIATLSIGIRIYRRRYGLPR